MKLLIIGANGRTGRELTTQAIEAGHQVIAYVRHHGQLIEGKQLTIKIGDLNNVSALTKAMKGCDAVLVTLGNPITKSSAPLFSFAIPNIILAMENAGVNRIVSLSALGVGETYANTRLPYSLGAKSFLKGNFADHERGEEQLKLTRLNWTTVHPGPLFNGPRTSNPIVKLASSGFKMKGAPRTYRADVAHQMLKLINDSKSYRHQVIMCSGEKTIK